MTLVKTLWECPPVRGKDGCWYRTFKICDLPRDVAVGAKPIVKVIR